MSMLPVRFLLLACLSIAFLTPIAANAADVPLIVDFRDGTVLRVSLPDSKIPWRRISDVGEVTDEPLDLSTVDQLRFVLTPATEQVSQVRRLVSRLGSEGFHQREEAQKELIARGAKFRTILEQILPKSKDFEVRWRLDEIIKKMQKDDPDTISLTGNDYDQLSLRGDKETELSGDVGDWSITADYRGAKITMNRRTVLALRNAPLGLDLAAEPPVVHMTRIAGDDDAHFPAEVTRIDFDRGPRGEAIPAGTDISEIFVPLGAKFSTSYEDSYVAIEPYNVGGRSGGRCAATHKPLYQGTITIQFCKPGNARLPAGVKYVGFWTSHIAPEGTALQAFDARGRQIAEIKTVRNQRDFLSLTTNVRIAYIRIVPDEDVDPDYAIDDLVFDTPKPLSEAGDPERYSVVLTSGERLHSTSLIVDDESLKMKEVSVGIDELTVPLKELAVLVPPRAPLPEIGEDQRAYVRTSDGSVLRAKGDDGLKLDRFPEIAIDENRLVAIWGATTILEEPSDEAWPDQGALMILSNDEFANIREWKLGAQWIDAEVEVADRDALTYANSPVVWFRKPAKRPKESGLLRTSSGEEIVLGTADGFELKSWSLDGVTIARGDKQWSIGLGEVRSLLLPRSSK